MKLGHFIQMYGVANAITQLAEQLGIDQKEFGTIDNPFPGALCLTRKFKRNGRICLGRKEPGKPCCAKCHSQRLDRMFEVPCPNVGTKNAGAEPDRCIGKRLFLYHYCANCTLHNRVKRVHRLWALRRQQEYIAHSARKQQPTNRQPGDHDLHRPLTTPARQSRQTVTHRQ